ncbi:hypothetical protein JYA63_03430 [Fictibacillus nanhaiensis]|uniref:Uncharacterized protein n=1 Tax=Fictibacillus nanhaiensis TaxID=742169 RepID=A0ABS2ZLP3_9BACL|nr:hypothetical protein [Fictibacillus nanhaiensis]
MKLIDEIVHELTDISTEWNKREITTEVRNLRIDLLIQQIQQLDLNYDRQPLLYISKEAKQVFNQLLKRYIHKAVGSLDLLKETTNKKSYNNKGSAIINRKLFFHSLHKTMERNIIGWIRRNDMQDVRNFQLLILRKEEVTNE